jgi:hypothetical protein
LTDKKRRTVADADDEIKVLQTALESTHTAYAEQTELADVETLKRTNELAELKELLLVRDRKIESLMAEVVPSDVNKKVMALKASCSEYTEGLYVSTGTPMFNGATGQMFTVSKPLKVTKDQLSTPWFLLQLSGGYLAKYEG